MSQIACVHLNSILERKVKTGALKGTFLVCNWINNILKSNSVRYHIYHQKNLSFLSRAYKGLQEVTKGYRGLQGFTEGYKRLEG